MSVVLNMTTTANGMAARSNDSTAVFERGEWPMFIELARSTGALIWGRRTHEIVRGYGPAAMAAFDGIGRIVMTHHADYWVEDGWAVATSPQEAVSKLAAAGHADALVGGGGTTNAGFLQAGLVDEAVLFVESVLLGDGVPAFASQPYEVRLSLADVEQVDPHLLKLRFGVVR
jgi:dihydrofolate reductase